MEEWKQIEDTYFSISNLGMIKNNKTGSILKAQHNRKGYKIVRVTINNKKRTFRIHRLVALNYINNPNNKPQVNHIDGNKDNNRYDNLEWCTNQENVNHAVKNGLWKNVFEASKKSNEVKKKPILAKNLETNNIIIFNSMAEAERKIGTRHINEVINGKRTQAKGYTFSYYKGGGANAIRVKNN